MDHGSARSLCSVPMESKPWRLGKWNHKQWKSWLGLLGSRWGGHSAGAGSRLPQSFIIQLELPPRRNPTLLSSSFPSPQPVSRLFSF